jgi:hypothetical protein
MSSDKKLDMIENLSKDIILMTKKSLFKIDSIVENFDDDDATIPSARFPHNSQSPKTNMKNSASRNVINNKNFEEVRVPPFLNNSHFGKQNITR